MDFDPGKFDRDELKEHLHDLGVKDGVDYQMDELLTRTTKNTRTGNEFGFKPVHVSVGSTANGQFYSGFDRDVEPSGFDATSQAENHSNASSFWIRFKEEWFQMRLFLKDFSQQDLVFRPYECRIRFRDLVHGGLRLRAKRAGSDQPDPRRITVTLIIQSRRPPAFTHRLPEILPGPVYDRDATEADFFYPCVDEAAAGALQTVHDPRATTNPGSWFTHQITFCITLRQYKLLWMCMVRFRLLRINPDFFQPSVPMIIHKLPTWSIIAHSFAHWSFSDRYLLESLLSHGTITLPEVDDVVKIMHAYYKHNSTMVLEGLFKRRRRSTIEHDLGTVARLQINTSAPTHCMMIRRCLVAPTRLILMPPQMETSNNLFRTFKDHADRFLRVQFIQEESGLTVTRETNEIDDALQGCRGLFARVRRTLKYGIHIAGRKYVFLCFGESQLKSKGCWMISEKEGLSVQGILKWMGDLDKERVIARHAARQGLCLSTSRAITLDLQVEFIHDITRTDSHGKEYVFTDGMGDCSQEVANACARFMGIEGDVSAVQVRYGTGIKGVISVSEDPLMRGHPYTLRVRDSMVKFKSSNPGLNALKVATYSPATLNRQVILLMESLGVSSDTLLDIFKTEKTKIQGLEASFGQERLSRASAFPLGKALDSGFKDDPLVASIVRLVKCRLLSDLKWKAWIEIPKSAFLMGVVDPTGTLQEGEVFCQIQRPNSSPSVVVGDCTAYRNPCLHPGDVRSVKAVDHMSMRHLKNVIVFSTLGHRPLPNMMGGGDVDGDFFSLIWDDRFRICSEYEPMDYTGPTPVRSSLPVTIDQTKEFFVDFFRNDLLGAVCNTHMALADKQGPYHDDCLKLAALASQAVDFVKTGVPVSHNDIPKVDEYPDFMGPKFRKEGVFKKNQAKSRQTSKALGRMFREIDPEPEFNELKELKKVDPLDRIAALGPSQEYQPYLRLVAKEMLHYDFELTGLMRRYGISEEECAAGLLLRSRDTRVKLEKDYDLNLAVREAYTELKRQFIKHMQECIKDNRVSSELQTDHRAWALISYRITYDPTYSQYREICWTEDAQPVLDGMWGQESLAKEDEERDEDGLLPELELRYSYPWLFVDDLTCWLQSP